MKKIISLFILCILLLSCFSAALAVDNIPIYLNGVLTKSDAPPINVNNRILIGARMLFETFGGNIAWDAGAQKVTINYQSTQIRLYINSGVAYVNDKPYNLDSPAIIVNGRTMIPIRFVSESLNFSVDWQDQTHTVYVTAPVVTPPPAMNIVDVRQTEEDVYYVITIQTTSPIENYSAYMLAAPDRGVVELYGFFLNGTQDISINNFGIQGVRFGQHDGYAKVVVDLQSSKAQTIFLSANKKEMYICYRKDNAPPVPTPIIIPTPKPGVKTVVLDPGHGGKDPGALGYDSNGKVIIQEKNLNLTIALTCGEILENAGYNVYYTRTDDTYLTLAEIYTFANKVAPDLFVSIHNNAAENKTVGGTMTFYSQSKDAKLPSGSLTSKQAAQAVQKEVLAALGTTDLNVRAGDDYSVIRNGEAVGILVECAFVTNAGDQKILLNQNNLIAAGQGIAKGIRQVLG